MGNGGSTIPRLRDRDPGRRREARPSRSTLHQWRTRAEGPRGCHPGEMYPIHTARQTESVGCSAQRYSFQYHDPVPGGISGPRPVLPVGLQRSSPLATSSGHGVFVVQNAGEQVQDLRQADLSKVPEDRGCPSRHAKGAGGRRRSWTEEEATGGTLRGHRACWQKHAILNDQPKEVFSVRSEVVQRLLAQKCELCGAEGACQVHHVRKLADLNRPGQGEKPPWIKRMAGRRRRLWSSVKSATRPFIENDRRGTGSKHRPLASRLRSKDSRAVLRGAEGKGRSRLPVTAVALRASKRTPA